MSRNQTGLAKYRRGRKIYVDTPYIPLVTNNLLIHFDANDYASYSGYTYTRPKWLNIGTGGPLYDADISGNIKPVINEGWKIKSFRFFYYALPTETDFNDYNFMRFLRPTSLCDDFTYCAWINTFSGLDNALVDSDVMYIISSQTTALETTALETTPLETTALETTALETTALETSSLETTNPLETTPLETTSLETTSANSYFGVGINKNNKLSYIDSSPSGDNIITLTSTQSVNNGIWTFVAVTRNKITGQVTLYINGVADTTGTCNVGTLASTDETLNSTDYMLIGSNTYFPGYTFGGSIGAILGYTSILSADDILRIFEKLRSTYRI